MKTKPDAATKAANRLVEENLGLAGDFVKRWAPGAIARGASMEMVVSAAHLGLVMASRHFDPTRGFAFSTLANRFMFTQLSNDVRIWNHHGRAILPLSFSGDPTRPDQQPPDDSPAASEARETKELIDAMWPRLNGQQRFVLYGRFWLEETLEQIGNRMGLTRERVRQIESAGLARLREITLRKIA